MLVALAPPIQLLKLVKAVLKVAGGIGTVYAVPLALARFDPLRMARQFAGFG
jgi:hypothetical protein